MELAYTWLQVLRALYYHVPWGEPTVKGRTGVWPLSGPRVLCWDSGASFPVCTCFSRALGTGLCADCSRTLQNMTLQNK